MKRVFKRYNKIIMVLIVLTVLTTSISLSATQTNQDVTGTEEVSVGETVIDGTEDADIEEADTEGSVTEEADTEGSVTGGTDDLDIADTNSEGLVDSEKEDNDSDADINNDATSSEEVTYSASSNSVVLNTISVDEAYTTEIDSSTGGVTKTSYGDYQVSAPDTENASYSVDIRFIRYDSGGNYLGDLSKEVYSVTYTDATTKQEATMIYEFEYYYEWQISLGGVRVVLTNVEPGTTVTVNDVIVEKLLYSNETSTEILYRSYYSSAVYVNVTNEDSNSGELVTIDEENPKALITGAMVSHTGSAGGDTFTRETTDTFDTIGDYTLEYLLSNYNVVSFNDIESTHIVGPIIALDNARRTTFNVVGAIDAVDTAVTASLVASDYASGISSYVGRLTSSYQSGNEDQTDLKLNYGMENSATDFEAPVFYTSLEHLEFTTKVLYNEDIDYVVLDDGSTFISPNDSGKQLTYQSDDFIDEDALYNAIYDTSVEIMENGTLEGSVSEVYTYDDSKFDGSDPETVVITMNGNVIEDTSDIVTIEAGGLLRLSFDVGESWTIKNADHLDEVNIIYPEGYDYFTNPYLVPTTINFACTEINPVDIAVDVDGDGDTETVSHSVFPNTLINGVEIRADQGYEGEYGEGGNKIIWNLPYIKTSDETADNRLMFASSGQNILGHIIAPNAEIWNYYIEAESGELKWGGGNLNGTALVKSFYSGEMEMHMWAYEGSDEAISATYRVEALKTVDGENPSRNYDFELTYVPDDGEIPEGILNTNFPLTASSSISDGKEGEISFAKLQFGGEGTFSFILKETVPDASVSDNITYDLTQYQIDITVALDGNGDYQVTKVEKYKIVDSSGNELEVKESVEDDVEFTFNNITTDTELIDIHLTKVSTGGNLLSGAKFKVTEMTSETDTTVPSGGYSSSATSDSDGKINISGLEKDTYYMVKETEAPVGFMIETGYWIIYINDKGFLESVTPVDCQFEVADEIGLVNLSEEQAYLEITLIKSNQMAELLEGVEFRLQRVVMSNGVPTVVSGGYDETYTTDENGEIYLEYLEADHLYMLTETSTPAGHDSYTGYWLIDVEGNMFHPSYELTYTMTEYDENHNLVGEVVGTTIYNHKIEFVLPETGGLGIATAYIIGLILVVVTYIFYEVHRSRRIRERINNKKQKSEPTIYM